MPLKNYDEHQKAKEKKPEYVKSGVACSEMFCAKCNLKHSGGDKPHPDSKLSGKESKAFLKKWHEEHAKDYVPCLGEMGIVQPEIKHTQLDLKRAICMKCGWRGWV